MVKFPFSDMDKKTITVMQHVTPEGIYKLEVTPSWPCYPKDGGGKETNFELELTLTLASGTVYLLTKIDNNT